MSLVYTNTLIEQDIAGAVASDVHGVLPIYPSQFIKRSAKVSAAVYRSQNINNNYQTVPGAGVRNVNELFQCFLHVLLHGYPSSFPLTDTGSVVQNF